MPRRWAWMIAGILMGFGFLFFTVWSASVDDSRTLAAILFAVASTVILTGEVTNRPKRPCPHKAQSGNPPA
jgi:predicted negative regulator of RcsB-dependent stress response